MRKTPKAMTAQDWIKWWAYNSVGIAWTAYAFAGYPLGTLPQYTASMLWGFVGIVGLRLAAAIFLLGAVRVNPSALDD